MDYHRLNQQLVKKMYPFTIVDDTMQKQENLRYSIALDLYVGCYTIILFP